VKANPEKSDRAIAEEIGVASNTVRTARKSVAQDCAPAKRKGKDGKSYTAKRAQPKRQNVDKVKPTVAKLVADGELVSRTKLAKEFAVGEHAVRVAAAEARGAQNLLDDLAIDPTTLTMSAQAKLEIAKRMIERKLNSDYAARMFGLDEEVRKRVLSEGKEYLAKLEAMEAKARETVARYQEYANDHKPLFTVDQFKAILMCLHPDGQRTADKLSTAFRLFNGKKLQLTGER
jgi:hypothetical protein